jgi:hypothetical protein
MNTLSEDQQFREIELEAGRHLEDSEVSKLAHFDAAAVLNRRHRCWIGIPATLSAIILTWLLTSPFKELTDPQNAQFLGKGLPIMLGLITSILTGLSNLLNLNEEAAKHREAAHKYQWVWRKCKNWKTEYPDATFLQHARTAVIKVRDRLNEIGAESPQIPKWAWKSVSRQRAAGVVAYSSDTNKAGK